MCTTAENWAKPHKRRPPPLARRSCGGILCRYRPGAASQPRTSMGIPSLYTEAPGGGGCDPDVVACFRDGVMNVMKHLGMIDGEPNRRRMTHHLLGDGNLDTVIDAPVNGFFQREVSLLEHVKRSQRLGTILDPTGAELASVEADQDGLIIMLRGLPRGSASATASPISPSLIFPANRSRGARQHVSHQRVIGSARRHRRHLARDSHLYAG